MNDPDSLYTREYIISIHMKAPHHALGLIDTAVMRKLMPDYQGDDLRAMIYKDVLNDLPRAMEYWEHIYQLDSIKKKPEYHLFILSRMSDATYVMGKYKDCIHYATEGVKIARDLQALGSEGNFLFTIGQSLRDLGEKQQAGEYMDQSIRTAEKSSNPKILPNLSYFYGQRMTYNMEDENFANATVMGEKRLEVIQRMEKEIDCPQGYIDQQHGYVYSKLAYAYAKSGNRQKALKYVTAFFQTDYAASPQGKREILPYYFTSGQYKEMIRIYDSTAGFLYQDTISKDFVKELDTQVEAYRMLKDIKAELNLRRRIEVIKDSLVQRERQDNALKLATLFQTHEKESQIKEAQTESQRLLLIVILMTGLFAAGCTVIFLLYKYTRTILSKNKILVTQIDDLDNYRSQLKEANEKIRILSAGIKKSSEPAKEEQVEEENMNSLLFKKLETIMEKEKLFLKKDLTREAVLQRLHIDKNRLSQMFQENTESGGLPMYINDFRLKWAIRLLKECPDFTIQAIAEESGFSNVRSFQRIFKEKIKMTPTEYRDAIKS